MKFFSSIQLSLLIKKIQETSGIQTVHCRWSTFSMANILRISFSLGFITWESVSLKHVCTCLQKEKDLGGEGRLNGGRLVRFSQKKGETRKFKYWCQIKNCSIAFLLLLTSLINFFCVSREWKTPHSWLGCFSARLEAWQTVDG